MPGGRLIPLVGWEIGKPLAISREAINLPRFNSDGEGSSLNQTALFGLELAFPARFGTRFGIAGGVGIAQSNGYFLSDPFPENTAGVDSLSGRPIPTDNVFDVEADETQAQVWLALLYDRAGFRLAVGPWIGYRGSENVTETERIVSPAGAVFGSEGARERVVAAGDPITTDRFRYGLSARISRDFPLSPHLALAPFIGTGLDGGALLGERRGFEALSVRAGVGFSVVIREQEDRPPAAPTSIDPVPIVDLYNADPSARLDDEVVIRRTSRLQTRYVQVPTRLPIGEEGELLGYYRRRTTVEARSFQPDDLATAELDEILRSLPDVIGYRLRSDPTLTLRLEAVRSEAAHCVELREYLAQVWSISPERVGLDTVRGEGGEVRRVMIRLRSSDARLFDPLRLRRQVETSRSSTIGLRSDLLRRRQGGSDEESWGVLLRRNGEVFARTGPEIGSSTFEVDPAGRDQGVIRAEMFVVGAGGDTIRAHDSIRYRFVVSDAGEETSWYLVGFGSEENDRITREAFLQLVAAETGEERGVEIRTAGGANAPDGEWNYFVSDLFNRLSRRSVARSDLTIGRLAGDHPLASVMWGGGGVIVVR